MDAVDKQGGQLDGSEPELELQLELVVEVNVALLKVYQVSPQYGAGVWSVLVGAHLIGHHIHDYA